MGQFQARKIIVMFLLLPDIIGWCHDCITLGLHIEG